jgi:5-methylcytosine-specific restriction endonuclease McrBC GTP-binding regulatory subunit McrB
MLFEKVTKEHILQGIKDFEEKGLPKEFGASSTYDVVSQDKKYPPKAIMAYANYHAEGRAIERYFKGGLGTDCFNAFERNGFSIKKKSNAMIKYKEYEKEVYNWLKNKNEQDPSYTFSLRQNGSKGAELDYFIGTEKSRYFGVTFWNIPVGFPGSSGDCIDLIFKLSKDYSRYSYDFKFTQTNSPHDDQNTSALNLIKSLTKPITENIGAKRISADDNKMFTIRSKPKHESYKDLNKMLKDVGEDLFKLIPIVNTRIEEEKKVNPIFKAHRITKEEFAIMKSKLLVRFDKYGDISKITNEHSNIKEQFSNWLKGSNSSNKINSYLRAVDILSEILNKDIYLEKNIFELTSLYKDLITNQRDVKGKYFYKKAPSYGNNGFYSASIMAYIEFLQHDENIMSHKSKNMDYYKTSLNQIFYGPPGTGKTYHTILEAAKIITQNKNINYKEAQNIFNENLGENLEFITFHQNYSYEDFIQGLRPDTDVSGVLSFYKSDGVFKRLADKALKNLKDVENPETAKKDFRTVFYELISALNEGDIEELEIKMKKTSFYITEVGEKSIEFRKNQGDSKHTLSISTLHKMYDKGVNDLILGGLQPYYNPILDLLIENGKSLVENVEKQNYVIIIDEINRANISRVFGELITLIEKDKRSHGALPLTATLPSGEKFIVPSNLYIIGTMNTADKSIALLDIALRRRFEFVPMYPDSSSTETKIVNDAVILDAINKEIINRKGHDFTIGHSYFMGEDYDLKNTIETKVIPLLLEYFMNDFEEVKKILKAAEINVDGWPMKLITND